MSLYTLFRSSLSFSVAALFPVIGTASMAAYAESPAPATEVSPASSVHSPQVAQLLKKMSETSHALNYQGTFTYQHKDNPSLQSFRIIHWVENGIEHDRLQHLNGPEREITRSGRKLGCGSLGDELLQGNLGKLNPSIAGLDQLYKFDIRGPERVAGRAATVLLALPLDPFRYSYFLSIDDETGLVLKSWLVDEKARPLERYQFVELVLNPDLSQMSESSTAKTYRATPPDVGDCELAVLKTPERWAVNWSPAGFAFVGQRTMKDNIDMLMYTDGLSTFSVFVQPAAGVVIPEGVAQRGATLAVMDAFSYQGQNYRVTVVGEIPVAAAQKIAQNVRGR